MVFLRHVKEGETKLPYTEALYILEILIKFKKTILFHKPTILTNLVKA